MTYFESIFSLKLSVFIYLHSVCVSPYVCTRAIFRCVDIQWNLGCRTLSSRTNRFPNIKPKQKTHRFPNRQTGNQVREMYGERESVTSHPPLSAASCSNLLCLFLIFFVFLLFFYKLLLNRPPCGHQLSSVQMK
jgi:hypothetical protein